MTHEKILGTPVSNCALQLPVDMTERQPENALIFVDPTNSGKHLNVLPVTEDSCQAYYPSHNFEALTEELFALSLDPLQALEPYKLVLNGGAVVCNAFCRNNLLKHPKEVKPRTRVALQRIKAIRRATSIQEELSGLLIYRNRSIGVDGSRELISR